ncbi:MAG: AmmeMemoRadiSam system protein B [Spirochaetia bacterium]
MDKATRAPLVEGIFYPAEEGELKRLLETGTGEIETPIDDKLAGIVFPHAAYEFILPFLLEGFSLLRRNAPPPKTIILAAGLHREKQRGIFLPPHRAFSSPIRDVPVDTEAVTRIHNGVEDSHIEELPFLEEHSFEVLLPPISLFFPEASVIPVLTGNDEGQTVSAFSQALELVENEETVITISSNITGETDRKNAELQRDAFIETLTEKSAEESEYRAARFMRLVREGRITACAAAAIAGIMGRYPDFSAIPLQTGSSRWNDEPREVYYGTVALTEGNSKHTYFSKEDRYGY